jgi:LPS O-antigen subunit length determinant protein (WzzB/FepE family)
MDITVIAAFTGPIVVILLAILGVLFRATAKWASLETSVRQIEKAAIAEQEQNRAAHIEMQTQMREDRNATNQRLRWLEENLWMREGDSHAVRGTKRG